MTKKIVEDRKQIGQGKAPVVSEEHKIHTFDPDNPPPIAGGTKKDTIIIIVLGAIIAFAIVWMMVPRLAPSRGDYERDITRLELDLVNIRAGYVAKANVPDFTGLLTLEDLASYVQESELNSSIANIDSRISALELAPEANNPIEYGLSGTFGNYLLSITASKASDYVAKITLVYITPQSVGELNDTLGNATKAFYGTWLTTPNRKYDCVLVWDSSDSFWKVAQVSFITGKFSLFANTTTDLPILFTGPKSETGYEHNAYAEVFPVIETTSDGGGGGI